MKLTMIIAMAAFLSASAEVGILMNLEGIEGSSTEPGHVDWIECAVVNSGCPSVPDPMTMLDHPPAERSGSLDSEALAEVEFSVLVKEVDKASPKLLSEFATGSLPDNLDLDLLTPEGETYLELDFEYIEFQRCREVEDGVEVVFSCEAHNWEFFPR